MEDSEVKAVVQLPSKDGKEPLLFMEANLSLRTININDEKGVSVRWDQPQIKDQIKSVPLAETKDQSQKSCKKQGLSV
ncbi:hypothetical protein [Pedobacter sp. V48]|uniref:hypothetical protein n=1 Tax=Pedobacter sp. V48 TaxID=509635 RepID=UPI0003E5A9AA|nr:hypothetical protein [Pedobacter sp. V48]ETZ19153.1 hypothetical protein N824_10450 [Pedobacter sp. V48]